jgi:flavin-binding protein dodecin
MSVLKVIEILANSEESWEDAVQNAVTHASKTIKNIRSVNISNQSATVSGGKIDQYRVNVKISFEVVD